MAELKYGWHGRILWIDLADRTHKDIDISDLCEEYMGARGLAIKLAWDHMKPGTKAFDPGNILMFLTGPVTGTPVFGSGRGYIFGVGAATYPDHFTRSGIGGRWATGLKYAGYDGIAIVNKSEEPLLIQIDQNEVKFHEASGRYWGQDVNTTEQLIREDFGPDADSCIIGPAGEKLVRWASVMCNTGHAAGQGGFGAVMGDKKVKALVFTGSKEVDIYDFEETQNLRKSAHEKWGFPKGTVAVTQPNFIYSSAEDMIKKGEITYASNLNVACRGCGAKCHNVNTYFRGLKGTFHSNVPNDTYKCVDMATLGWLPNSDIEKELYMEKLGRPYRWPVNLRSALEAVAHTNNLGLNSWEFQSIYLWLTEMEMEGVDVSEYVGFKWDVDDPEQMPKLVWMCGNREGIGDELAEGIARLEEKYGGVWKKYSPHAFYGYCTHSLGTDCWRNFRYPHWVPVVLQYAIDSRDPISDSGHRYVLLAGTQAGNGQFFEEAAEEYYGVKWAIGPHHTRRKCEYYPEGDLDEETFDDLAYTDKEYTAYKNTLRGIIIGCGVLCDRYYPLLADPNNTENKCIGDFDIEAKIMSAVTGVDYTTETLETNAEKIYLMERCYSIMEHNRDKSFDMQACDIQPRGDWTTGKRVDPVRFEALLGRFYSLAEWDEKGIPTSKKLKEHGLEYIDELMASHRDQ